MPSNRRLQSPLGRTGSLARGSYNFRKRSLRRSHCEHGGVFSLANHALALACISFEMDQISFRISLQKGSNFVINFVSLKKKSHISHSLGRISQNFLSPPEGGLDLSNRRLQSPSGRTGSLARGSQNFAHFAKFRKILRHLLILASSPSYSAQRLYHSVHLQLLRCKFRTPERKFRAV